MLTADVPAVLGPAAGAEHRADAGGRDHVRGPAAHRGGGDGESGLHAAAGGGG